MIGPPPAVEAAFRGSYGLFWQHVCLWMLFLQNLLRCLREGEGALHRSTICKVLQYTAPLASELADTLKDWIVTGICFVGRPHSTRRCMWWCHCCCRRAGPIDLGAAGQISLQNYE